MDKAVIYSRVSTDDQDYQRQIDELNEYAEHNKLTVLRVFAEKVSGSVKGKHRPEYKKMEAFIDGHEIKHVLVWELSRLGRSMIDVMEIVDGFNKKKVSIHIKNNSFKSLDENSESDIMSMGFILNMSLFAEMERKLIVSRSISGLDRHIRNGGAKSNCPYGFKSKNKMLAREEGEGEIIMKIFDWYENKKMRSDKIARQLNSDGVQPRLKEKWVGKTVMGILQNPIYYGKRRYRHFVHKKDDKGNRAGIDKSVEGELLDTNLTPYIDEERWNNIQELIKKNSTSRDNTTVNVNILQGVLKCGCGCGMYMVRRKDLKDNAYVCLSNHYSGNYGEKCGKRRVNIDGLNSLMYHALNEIGPVEAEEGWLENIYLKLDESAAELDNALDEIDRAESRLKKSRQYLKADVFTVEEYQADKKEDESKITKAKEHIKYWTAQSVSCQTHIEQMQPKEKIYKGADGEMYVDFEKPEFEYYSSESNTLKSQIKRVVESVVVEDTYVDLSSPSNDSKLVGLQNKYPFTGLGSYPTLVTIKLISGKEYCYVLPSRYPNYITPLGEIKELTQKIDI